MTSAECDRLLQSSLTLLPKSLDTRAARRQLIAIGLQESRLVYREQIGGPARGLWQFERGGGVKGVLTHPATAATAARACDALGVLSTPEAVYQTLSSNDTLAACFARLLLWTDPAPLPDSSEQGWNCYIRTWRPGKPHAHTWAGFWKLAQEAARE